MSAVVDEHQIDEIVRRIMDGVDGRRTPKSVGPLGIFATVDEALAGLEVAQRLFNRTSIAHRKAYIHAMRDAAIQNAHRLAQMAVDETKMGRTPRYSARTPG